MSVAVVLDVFSGRPNPEWHLSSEDERELERRLTTLDPTAAAVPDPPGLGYRGFRVQRDDGDELHVYRGVVDHGGLQMRDPERSLERWLYGIAGRDLDEPVLDDVGRELDAD